MYFIVSGRFVRVAHTLCRVESVEWRRFRCAYRHLKLNAVAGGGGGSGAVCCFALCQPMLSCVLFSLLLPWTTLVNAPAKNAYKVLFMFHARSVIAYDVSPSTYVHV